MILLFINGIDRTADLSTNSFRKTNQIQQRSDVLDFTIFQGTQPLENQDVRVFICDTIGNISGATITLDGNFQRGVKRFYPGQKVFLSIGTINEEVGWVLSYDETNLQLVLTAAPTLSHAIGDAVGEQYFGGITSRVKDINIEVLSNLEYPVSCVGYTKFFDKENISDSWINADSRYIINSFVNSTINYNKTIDSLSYINNAAIQAVWIEAQDGLNPTVDTSDFIEDDASGVFAWTFSSGTAKWEATLSAIDLSDFTHAVSGPPPQGDLMLWGECVDYTKVTSIKLRIGSSNTNYTEVTLPRPTTNEFKYSSIGLATGTTVGVPVWTSVVYAAIIITESGSSSIKLNGFRLNAKNSFTLYNVNPTVAYADYRINQKKPMVAMQDLAKAAAFVWFIDYQRDIHFVANDVTAAPFNLSDSSNNFYGLEREIDQSQLGNRIVVKGGESISSSYYSQVFQGDNAAREWVLIDKFADASITIDNNTSTHTAAVGTNTTNIKIVGHGLSTGDHVINRTRSNAVRQITVVDADNFTVQTVTSQTSGDTITFFSVSATLGVENLDDEASFDYLSNYQAQSIRASSQTGTLPATSYIRIKFKQKFQIQVQYSDGGSISALQAAGIGDGIFDLAPITDNSIQDPATAFKLAQAQVDNFKNPIISGQFQTDWDGLKAGQIIHIQDSWRGMNEDVLIQTVRSVQKEGPCKDYFIYTVTFGTTLFGIVEFYQKLLAQQGQVGDTSDVMVVLFPSSSEDIQISKTETVQKGGFKTPTVSEDVHITKSENAYKMNTGTWQYEPSVGQPVATRYNLCDFG